MKRRQFSPCSECGEHDPLIAWVNHLADFTVRCTRCGYIWNERGQWKDVVEYDGWRMNNPPVTDITND